VKPSAVLGSRPTPECYFFLYCTSVNWFKAFLVDKSFVLATFSDSKLVMHMTNSAVFSVHGAVFSEECCMEKLAVLYGKISTVICLMFTHANALIIFTLFVLHTKLFVFERLWTISLAPLFNYSITPASIVFLDHHCESGLHLPLLQSAHCYLLYDVIHTKYVIRYSLLISDVRKEHCLNFVLQHSIMS